MRDDYYDLPTLTTSSTVSVNEADGNIAIPIYLNGTTYETIQVYYTTEDGTATSDADFDMQDAQIHSIAPNSQSSTLLIPILDDKLYEGPESLIVTLSNPEHASFQYSPYSQYYGQGQGTREINVVIVDDETSPIVTLENLMPKVTESDGQLTLRANLSNASSFPTSINYSTVNLTAIGGTGSGDFETQTNQTLDFPVGQTYADITIPIRDDDLSEGEQTFALVVSDPSNAKFANYQSMLIAIVTIVDDESPTLSVVSSTLNASEGVGTATIELMLSGPANEIVEVTYSTLLGSTDTAEQADFTPQSSSKIAIVSPATTGVIAIPILNDTDGDDETFTLRLTGVTGASFPNGSSSMDYTVNIVDDDGLSTLTVASNSVSVTEGDGSAVINLTLSPAATENVSITYSTRGATASNDSTDYTVRTNTMKNISSGSTSGTISIPIVDDRVLEGDETFIVEID